MSHATILRLISGLILFGDASTNPSITRDNLSFSPPFISYKNILSSVLGRYRFQELAT